MKKVSLIIPVYNTAEYLEECLYSACRQTYPNMEIICVDDGSTDGSGRIVDEFACKYENVIAIHKENSGESSARNIGLKACSGDYIGFMDCDDWIDLDMYEKLADAMERFDTDMAASSWYKEEISKTYEVENKYPVVQGVFGQEQLLKYVYERDAYQGFAYMWNKLYKKELLQNSIGDLLLFDEKLKLGGDVLYLAQLLLHTKTAIYLDKPFYHYRQRTDSGSHAIDLQRRMDWLTSYEIVIEIFNEKGIKQEIMNLVKRFLVYHSSNAAQIAYEQKCWNELMLCQKIMKQYQYEYECTNRNYQDRIKRFQKILEYREEMV